MRRAMIAGMLLWAGCGAIQPETNLDAIMRECPNLPDTREVVLGLIEVHEDLRQIGLTFNEEIERLDEAPCGQDPFCRQCVLAVLEWVYFGIIP